VALSGSTCFNRGRSPSCFSPNTIFLLLCPDCGPTV
jgi:hypothetical protein